MNFLAPASIEARHAASRLRSIFHQLDAVFADPNAINVAPLFFDILGIDGTMISSKSRHEYMHVVIEALYAKILDQGFEGLTKLVSGHETDAFAGLETKIVKALEKCKTMTVDEVMKFPFAV